MLMYTHRFIYIFIYIDRYVCVCVCVYFYIRGSLNKFPDFFRMGTFIDFIDSTYMKL